MTPVWSAGGRCAGTAKAVGPRGPQTADRSSGSEFWGDCSFLQLLAVPRTSGALLGGTPCLTCAPCLPVAHL